MLKLFIFLIFTASEADLNTRPEGEFYKKSRLLETTLKLYFEKCYFFNKSLICVNNSSWVGAGGAAISSFFLE